MVTVAGNDALIGLGPSINGYPALFKVQNRLPNLVVVGASNIDGHIFPGSQFTGSIPEIYAPGQNIEVGDNVYAGTDGTSL